MRQLFRVQEDAGADGADVSDAKGLAG